MPDPDKLHRLGFILVEKDKYDRSFFKHTSFDLVLIDDIGFGTFVNHRTIYLRRYAKTEKLYSCDYGLVVPDSVYNNLTSIIRKMRICLIVKNLKN